MTDRERPIPAGAMPVGIYTPGGPFVPMGKRYRNLIRRDSQALEYANVYEFETDAPDALLRRDGVAAFEAGAKACRAHQDPEVRGPALNPYARPTDPNARTGWHDWNRGWNSVGPNPARGSR